jgi:site-specific recombinase XerD
MRARFYLVKKLVDSGGAAPIYINIHHRSHRLRYYTGERIKPEKWNSEQQRAKSDYIGHASLNDLLDTLAEEPKAIERNARIAGIDCTVEYLKEQLSYNKAKPKDFIGVVDEFIREEGLRNSWSSDTKKQWRFFKNNLAGFNRRYRLELDSINDQFAQAFIKAMLKQDWTNVTIRQHISMAIQFASWARRKGYHSSTAYRYIEIDLPAREPETNAVTLTIEEIARLSQLSFGKNESRYEKVRDLFLFSCLTGLRHADLKHLRRSSIKYNYLIITSQKTEESIRVPLVDPAKALLEKYKDSGEVHPIPLVSQQKYNQYLKVIGRRAGLSEKVIQHHYKGREKTESILPKWKLLTSQVGRKTFLSLAVFLEIPLETVSRITDLKPEKLKAYYDILDSRKSMGMSLLNQLIP